MSILDRIGRAKNWPVKLHASQVLKLNASGTLEPFTLHEIVETFLNDLAQPPVPKSGSSSDRQRKRSIEALEAFSHLLWELSSVRMIQGELADASITIDILTNSLRDLAVGNVAPMLMPVRAQNPGPVRMDIQVTRAHAAAAMEALIRTGEDRRSAALTVAKAIQDWRELFRARSSAPLWKVVARWRDDLRARARPKPAVIGELTTPDLTYGGLLEHWEDLKRPTHPNHAPGREHEHALDLIRMRKGWHDSGKVPS